MYKLIALDMDGTLLNKNKEISQKTFDTIKKVKESGKKVVLATGRPLNGVKRYVEHLDLLDENDHVITFNGALVQNTSNGEVLLDLPLDYSDYVKLGKLSAELGVHIHALTDCSVLTPKDNPYTQIESTINQLPVIEQPISEVDSSTLIVKVMFIDDPELLDDIMSKLPEWVYDKYAVLRSTPYFLEFLDKRVNKGVGVEAVIQELGITKEEVICVGDAGNDLAMIEYAGLGVAMGNATNEVKDAADYITCTNEEDGVAHVIDKFMM